MYSEEDFLQLSGIMHFSYCRRRWALIHIEQLWVENELTADGRLLHEKVHNPFIVEKRKDTIFVRDLAVHSRQLGVTGKCDMVEFVQGLSNGVELVDRKGKWTPYIVEYKHGKPQTNDSDRLQLTLQAMCLEEMLVCDKMQEGSVYYGETKRRERVALTDELRNRVKELLLEMHNYYYRGYTPRVKGSKSCVSCSLYDLCVTTLPIKRSVSDYITESLREE